MRRRLVCLLAAMVLAGCQVVGPKSIEAGRDRYNDVIQDTSKEQVFQNLIRIRENEPTLFMDVTEVDSTLTLTGTATAGIANVGAGLKAAGQIGSVSGSATYTENPTIRYFPLAGQALVEQIASPITPQSIAYLDDSEWPLIAVLEFSVENLTYGYEDYGLALDTIARLDDYGALRVLAGASSEAVDEANPASGTKTSPVPDTLVLYLMPQHPLIFRARASTLTNDELASENHIWHLWLRLLRLYPAAAVPAAVASAPIPKTAKTAKAKTAAAKRKPAACTAPDARALDALDAGLDTAKDAVELQQRVACVPRQIELRAAATMVGDYKSIVLHTRSALGTLKAAMRGLGVAFVPDEATAERDYQPDCGTYYMKAADPTQAKNPDDRRILTEIANAMNTYDRASPSRCQLTALNSDGYLDVNDYETARAENLFFSRRYFILIVKGTPPADAYASYVDSKGQGFYIRGNDDISKENFSLICQLLTMQAVASPAGALVPTVSVGGH